MVLTRTDKRTWLAKINWPNVPTIARLIATKMDLTGRPTPEDRELVLKVAALAQGRLSEHIVWDSVEAVRQKYLIASEAPKKPRCAYWHGTLASKCEEAGENFNRLLAMIEIPEHLRKPPERQAAGAPP